MTSLVRKIMVLWVIGMSLVILDCSNLRGADARAPCDVRLPCSLKEALVARYIGYRLVTLNDLVADQRSFWRLDFPNGCPGIAEIDLDGNGWVDIGLNLLLPSRQRDQNIFVLALRMGAQWELVQVTEDRGGPVAVLWADKSVRYESHEGESLIFPNGAFVLAGYGSWSRAYGFVDSELRFVQLTD